MIIRRCLKELNLKKNRMCRLGWVVRGLNSTYNFGFNSEYQTE
ncbi:hypothetical protein M595_4174 [Lyngbya aestuarii BL J]|uniref:Uncharacterized protein n=1 Tax=Lyngbya aestuarii BL J TaxID=1348334 RepID=U7QDG8_9CYAN|nr:hypothetical protein M595_4174 [Lyngbya aestuarii BL J]